MRLKRYIYCLIWSLKNIAQLIELNKNYIGLCYDESKHNLNFIDQKIRKLKIKEIEYFELIPNHVLPEKLCYSKDSFTLSTFELLILCGLVKLKRPKIIFELGTFEGNTTLNLANNIVEGGIVYTFNLAQEFVNFEVGKYFKSFKKGKIKQIYGDSQNYDFSKFYNKLDLIFIDGGHKYHVVKKDTENMLKCVKNNGIIVWHDYDKKNHIRTMDGILDALVSNNAPKKLYTILGTSFLICIMDKNP